MLIPPNRLPSDVREIYEHGVDPHCDYEVGSDGIVLKAFEDARDVTVDRLLDHIDLALEWYIPSDDAFEFVNFIRLVLGEEPENSNPLPHYFLMDCMFKSPCVKPFFMVRNIDFDFLSQETVVLCSREFSKSTLITYLIIFMAAKGHMPGFGPVNFGLYVSDSMQNNVKTMMDKIKRIYYESVYLQSIFEDVHFTQEEIMMVRKPSTPQEIEAWNQVVNIEKRDKKYVPGRMKRTFSMKGKGCMTSTRGASDALFRPQFVFLDDLVANEKDAYSKTIMDSIESTIESDVRGGLSGTGYFMVAIGTPYTKNDPIYRRIEEGLMLPVVFPRGNMLPTDELGEEGFTSVWPDRHTYDKCRKAYLMAKKAADDGNNYKYKKLLQEHYLRISSDEDRMISDEMLDSQWYKRVEVSKSLFSYNLVATTDFTTTGSKGSDLSGIAIWAVSSNFDYYLLDLSLRKLELETQYNELFRMCQYWTSISGRGIAVGIETDGQQKSHIHSVKQKMRLTRQWFEIARQKGSKLGTEGIKSALEGGNKHWRFRQSLPLFQNKKIYFPEELAQTQDMRELMEEIRYATYENFGSKYDDGCDLVSMIPAMEIIAPPVRAGSRGNRNVSYVNNNMSDFEKRMFDDNKSYRDDDSAYSTY